MFWKNIYNALSEWTKSLYKGNVYTEAFPWRCSVKTSFRNTCKILNAAKIRIKHLTYSTFFGKVAALCHKAIPLFETLQRAPEILACFLNQNQRVEILKHLSNALQCRTGNYQLKIRKRKHCKTQKLIRNSIIFRVNLWVFYDNQCLAQNCKHEDVLLLNIFAKLLTGNQSLRQCYLHVMDKKRNSLWIRDVFVISPNVNISPESTLEG